MSDHANQPFSGEVFKQLLIESKFISPDVSGCSPEEIEQAKIWQQVSFLPRTYIEYLSAIGHNTSYCDPFHNCEDWGYKTLHSIKSRLGHDLEFIDDTFTLPNDAFVFAEYYQGYYWLYFLTGDNNDNPPVYLAHESEGIIKISDSFTAFLFERFDAVIRRQQAAKDRQAREAKKLQEMSVKATEYAHQSKIKDTAKVEKSKSLWEQIADFLGISR